MELYKIKAWLNNIDKTIIFDFLPENFEGVKINQSFSFTNPIGFNPKFSVETMRIVKEDKAQIDEIFDAYGLESDVEIEIQKLNLSGTGYAYLSKFAIDFESYEKFDFYSEFALKSVSVIDFYNSIKNTEQQIELAHDATLPNTQKFINYVSLKTKSFYVNLFQFEENNESKFYNSDFALLTDIPISGTVVEDADIYNFGAATTKHLFISVSGTLICNIASLGASPYLTINIFKNNSSNLIYTLHSKYLDNAGDNYITFDLSRVDLGSMSFSKDDFLYITSSVDVNGGLSITHTMSGTMYFDLKIVTDVSVVNSDTQTIKYAYTSEVLKSLFNNNISIPQDTVFETALTSSSHLDSLATFATIKPKEFLADFCLMVGAVLNFKSDGSVEIKQMPYYFNDLLGATSRANAVEITDFKDLSINYNTSLNFASVSVGQEISDYDVYTYLSDWNKILTFKQESRNASENLDLSLSKYRGDFSGMLDYFYKRSQQKTATSKDNFIFNPLFYLFGRPDNTTPEIYLYDEFSPRAILNNWAKFLSFCFQNFGKNTLTISSNGGSSDNLNIQGVNQMDDLVLTEIPRLLPIQYNLTGLIDNVDFSEKIIKINHEGADVYLFVFDAETTDQLNEQTIKGLKINFNLLT